MTDADKLDTPVWSAAEIAAVINRSPRATFHLLETGKLDARKIGKLWTSTPRRLLKSLEGATDAA